MYVKVESLWAWAILATKMLRIRTVLMMWLFMALGDAATKTTTHLDWRLAPLALIIALLFINATSVNDLADEEIDKVNLPGHRLRPLTGGTAKSKLRRLGVVAGIIAGLIALTIGPAVVGLVIAAILMNWAYSRPPLRISYRGILAPLFLALCYVAIPFLIGASLNLDDWPPRVFGLLVGLYVTFIGRVILKDFRDVEGDRQFGKRTFLVRHGQRLTCQVSAAAWLAGDIIIIGLFLRSDLWFTLLLQPLVLAVLWTLNRLAHEARLDQQLVLVSLVGRLGNAMALLLLTILTLGQYGYSLAQKIWLVLMVAALMAYACYLLARQYLTAETAQTALAT